MRFLSADFIFNSFDNPLQNGILVIQDDGTIEEVIDTSIHPSPPSEKIEKYNGFICPGFVNAHCHLELSHLKGKFTQKKGLPHFIEEVITRRNHQPDKIQEDAMAADAEMYNSGIVAVGDISNTSDSILVKQKSKIYYHTFIELFDIIPSRTNAVFEDGLKLLEEYRRADLSSNLTPHAPYTVTPQLMMMVLDHVSNNNGIISIHNQETEGENEMFLSGTGNLIGKLKQLTGTLSDFKPTSNSSLITFADMNKTDLSVQFVHNTFTGSSDIDHLNGYKGKIFWCLCINANLFIEDRVPPVDLLLRKNCRLTIGTDSYASNLSLSVLDELKAISEKFPKVPLDVLIKSATINGAELLNIEGKYGSFQKQKSPGILLIENVDLKTAALTKNSKVKRLI